MPESEHTVRFTDSFFDLDATPERDVTGDLFRRI
jgi:hypothetical protein